MSLYQHTNTFLFAFLIFFTTLSKPCVFFLSFKKSKIGCKNVQKWLNKYFQLPPPQKTVLVLTLLSSAAVPPSPRCLASLLAGENFRLLAAGIAIDKAAPVELAVALPDPRVRMRVVAPAAAHHIATVRLGGGAVAQPAPCSSAARCRVFLAVVWRTLQVHQIRVGGLLVAPGLFEAQEGGLAQP